jgi:hypothetical protein
MPNYCLLLGCAAALSFTVAIAAQPAPATKPAKPARSIEAAPKAVSPNVEKEAAPKSPARPKEPAISFNSVRLWQGEPSVKGLCVCYYAMTKSEFRR